VYAPQSNGRAQAGKECMSDIIREVDEDLRRERFMKLWERYGIYAVVVAVLVVAAVGGWRAWDWYATREAAKSGARFESAIKLANEGRRFEAEAAFNALAKDGTAGYRMLARFRAAAEAGKSDPQGGVAAYDAIAADTSLDPVFRDIARAQAALLLIDTASVAEITSRMQPLLTPTGPLRHSARELIGLAHYRAGERAAAAKLFAEILADQEVPPSMRNRVQVLNALLAGEAGAPAPSPATQ
jgi:hypothetical protein